MESVKEKVLYLRDVMKLSFRQIEKQTGIPRKRLAKIYRGHMRKKRIYSSALDQYQSLIVGWFREYPSLKAFQVYDWLKERNVDVSYSLVAQYTKHLRKKKEKIYHNLEFLPGEEAQVDWAFINYPGLGKLCCFVLILSYSRYLFAHLFSRHSFEFFIEGHLLAFKNMKGIPRSLKYDNLKSVVLKRKPDTEHNPLFLEFCRHYGIQIRLCNPGAGNEKGRVERAIRTIKENFFAHVENFSSLSSLNIALHDWVKEKNNTIHRSTEKKPADSFLEEKLKPLPQIPWKNIFIHPQVKSLKTGMIIFDTNQYSVPEYLAQKFLSIHSSATCIEVYDGKNRVATHTRVFERGKKIVNPLHRTYSKLSSAAKADRIYNVIKNMNSDIADFLSKNETVGEDPKKSAYQIFKLLKTQTRSVIIGICKESLDRKSPRIKTLLSYLHLDQNNNNETVQPLNTGLLTIEYNKRSLEDYND